MIRCPIHGCVCFPPAGPPRRIPHGPRFDPLKRDDALGLAVLMNNGRRFRIGDEFPYGWDVHGNRCYITVDVQVLAKAKRLLKRMRAADDQAPELAIAAGA